MTPTFRIVADGADITALINDRLLLLRTTDKPGMESDDFELRIDDRDSAVSLPSRGTTIEIFLGYTGAALSRMGRYTVDEVELSGPPDTLVIRGKASDMRGSGKTTRSGSWEGVSLASIVSDVAARNGWQPVCPLAIAVPRADQLSESDFNFITRLAKQYDCTAKVADGKLLVMRRQAGQSASGKLLGAITLTRSDGSFALPIAAPTKPCAHSIRTPRRANCKSSPWPTTTPRTACRQCIPTAISPPTNPPQNKRPRLGYLPSTVRLLQFVWKCPGALTCLPNAALMPKASMSDLMVNTRSTRSSRYSPKAAGALLLNAMAARKAKPRPKANRRKRR